MYVVRVLGKDHMNEELQDLFVELLTEAENWYFEYQCSDVGSKEENKFIVKWKAYERACLECFRLAILRK